MRASELVGAWLTTPDVEYIIWKKPTIRSTPGYLEIVKCINYPFTKKTMLKNTNTIIYEILLYRIGYFVIRKYWECKIWTILKFYSVSFFKLFQMAVMLNHIIIQERPIVWKRKRKSWLVIYSIEISDEKTN